MVLPAHVTLAYSVTIANNQTEPTVVNALDGARLYTSPTADPVLCQAMGLTVQSDTTGAGGGVVTRTIVLNITNAASPSSPAKFDVHLPTADVAQAVLFSSSPLDTATGPGCQQVLLEYTDEEGNHGTLGVNLEGRTPVPVPLVPGTKGIFRVLGMSTDTVGSSGGSLGQITLSNVGANGLPDVAIAMMPASYFGFCNQSLQAMVDNLRNLFTATLARAVVSPVTAAVPVLS